MKLADRLRGLLESPRLPIWVALAAVLLGLPSLAGGFAMDDHGMAQLLARGAPAWDLFDFTRFGTVVEAQEKGFVGWWASPSWAISFFRPVSGLSHGLDFALWPGSPWLMHLHSVLLYGLLCGLAALLYRRLGTPLAAAGLAALLFAFDDVHAQTVGWISGRNAVLAALPALAALWVHDRWRREAWRPGAVLAPLLVLLSVLAAEAGLAASATIVAYSLCLDRGSWWRRLRSLLPYAVVLLGWQIAYKALGYGAHGSGLYRDAAEAPLTFLISSVENAWVLGLAQLTLPVSTPLAALGWGWMIAALLVGLMVLAMSPLLRASALARFYALSMALAALPFGATEPSDRTLLPLGFGAAGLIGLAAHGARTQALPRPARWTTRGLFFFAGVLSPLLFVPSLFLIHLMEPDVRRLEAALPEQGTAVVISVPFDILMLYPEAVRFAQDRPWPEHVYTLHGGMDELELTRCGPRCLQIEPAKGWLATPLDRLSRPADEPFHPGWIQGFDAMTAKVIRVAPDGRPLVTAFLFEQPLEEIHFIAWVEGRPRRWQPPAIDEPTFLETRYLPGG
jgi:hypothetical protein